MMSGAHSAKIVVFYTKHTKVARFRKTGKRRGSLSLSLNWVLSPQALSETLMANLGQIMVTEQCWSNQMLIELGERFSWGQMPIFPNPKEPSMWMRIRA